MLEVCGFWHLSAAVSVGILKSQRAPRGKGTDLTDPLRIRSSWVGCWQNQRSFHKGERATIYMLFLVFQWRVLLKAILASGTMPETWRFIPQVPSSKSDEATNKGKHQSVSRHQRSHPKPLIHKNILAIPACSYVYTCVYSRYIRTYIYICISLSLYIWSPPLRHANPLKNTVNTDTDAAFFRIQFWISFYRSETQCKAPKSKKTPKIQKPKAFISTESCRFVLDF